MGLSSVASVSSSINYPRYTRVVSGNVLFAKDNIWLNGHKVRIGGGFSDTARVLNRYSAKTGVKAEVVCNNNVVRLKLIVRGRNLTIHDPKGVLRSLQIGKNIGASDKMLIQIICRGKVNLSYNHPVRSLTVPALVSGNNNKILNKLRQTIHQVNYQEEVEDDLAEVDSDDDQQILAAEFSTDLYSPPSLLLGSGRRYMVGDSSMPSLLAEVSNDQVDSGDEQIIGGDFINQSSSRSRLFESGSRYSFVDQPMSSFQPESSLLDDIDIDPMPRLMPGPRWSIQSMPSFQPGPSLLDGMDIDPPALLDPFRISIPSFQSESSSLDAMEIDLPPLSEDGQVGSEGEQDVAVPLWQLTPQKSYSVVGVAKSGPSRRTLRQSRDIPAAMTPEHRKHSSIIGKGYSARDFRAKLAWLRVHDDDLPSIYKNKDVFTEKEKLTIISRHNKIKSLQKELSPAVPSAAPTPARRSKNVSRGGGDARRDFTTILNYCKRRDPENPLYSKISFGKDDKTKIMSIYAGLKSSGALSPVPSMIPPAYRSNSLSLKQDSNSSAGVDIIT